MPLRRDEHDVVAVAHRRRCRPPGRCARWCGCRARPCRRGAACGSASPSGPAAPRRRRPRRRRLPVPRRRSSIASSSAPPSFAGGVGAERRPLAVAVLADRQQVAVRVGDHHADDLVVAGQVDALDAAGVAAHRPGVGLVEADRHALARAQHDLVAGLRQGHVDQRVAFVQADADDAALLAAGCSPPAASS